MDIYDKLIIVCIIFTILAILSIVFGCHYLTKKTEGFVVDGIDMKTALTELTDLFKNGAEDFEILEYMKKKEKFLKNEKFVNKVVEALENEENFKKSKENFKKSKENFKKSKKK